MHGVIVVFWHDRAVVALLSLGFCRCFDLVSNLGLSLSLSLSIDLGDSIGA